MTLIWHHPTACVNFPIKAVSSLVRRLGVARIQFVQSHRISNRDWFANSLSSRVSGRLTTHTNVVKTYAAASRIAIAHLYSSVRVLFLPCPQHRCRVSRSRRQGLAAVHSDTCRSSPKGEDSTWAAFFEKEIPSVSLVHFPFGFVSRLTIISVY